MNEVASFPANASTKYREATDFWWIRLPTAVYIAFFASGSPYRAWFLISQGAASEREISKALIHFAFCFQLTFSVTTAMAKGIGRIRAVAFDKKAAAIATAQPMTSRTLAPRLIIRTIR